MVKAGQNEQTRAASLYGVIVHGNEIAGTAYAYLRTKGLVPPSTERAQGAMRGRGESSNVENSEFGIRDGRAAPGGPPFFDFGLLTMSAFEPHGAA